MTDDATSDRGYHEVALDISDRNWYVITIGYTFKIIEWYVPGRFGIHMTIGDYTSLSNTTIWVGWWFVTNGENGDQQRTFIEVDQNPSTLVNYGMDYIIDETGYVFLEMIVRLDTLGRLTAKLYRGNQEYDLNINYVELSSYLPTEYYIQDVGIKNYNMGTTCKAFFINGGISPYVPTEAPTSVPTDVPSIEPTESPSNPSNPPSLIPTTFPSKIPSDQPSNQPSSTPSISPNTDPSTAPIS